MREFHESRFRVAVQDLDAEIRARMLDATQEALIEHGFGAEVTKIARRAGVGVGTIYRHFGSKEKLLGVIVSKVLKETRADLTNIAATIDDAHDAVRATMNVGFKHVEKYGQLTIELMAGSYPANYTEASDAREETQQFFAALVHRGVEQGHFAAGIDIELAVALWYALVAPPILPALLATRSVEEVASAVTDFLLLGLGAVTGPASHEA